MAAITDIQNPWRRLLRTPASWRGIEFHVETGAKLSGRRTVVHEYPKKNQPYAEDMGQQAQRFHFSGYLIYRPDNPRYVYTQQRELLVKALDADGPGVLVHPVFTFGKALKCMCERYSMTENRQRGGFTEFEMQFVELGEPGNLVATKDPAAAVNGASDSTEQSAVGNFNNNVQPQFSVTIGEPVIGQPTP